MSIKPQPDPAIKNAGQDRPTWGIDSLLRTVEELENRLAGARKTAPNVNWFPYESLGSLDHLDRTLTGYRRSLSVLLGQGPVLDVGCGDGEMSFLLESMGCEVRAVDCSLTNANRMEGIRALKLALGSKVEICDNDIDAGLRLGAEERFSATFLLGILYHLKNPFGVLETLSRHSVYCFVSTRVARRTPDHAVDFGTHPLAYLVGADELNSDSTNYWIFSEQGLRRLFYRTGWDVIDYASFGNRLDSDPLTPGGDERAWCLLRSRVVRPIDPGIELLGGWHADEGGWRWTERRFFLAVSAPASDQAIELTFWISPEVAEALGPIQLSCHFAGQSLGMQSFSGTGHHTYRAILHAVPNLTDDGPQVVEFVADKCLGLSGTDDRELCLAVTALHVA